MLEILKFILSLSHELAQLATRGEQRRSREMGKQLLLVYVFVNEVVVSACKILEHMQQGLECVEFRMATWNESFESAVKFSKFAYERELREHAVLLWRLWNTVTGFEFEFQILDADTHRKLAALIDLKFNVMWPYVSHLESGEWLVVKNVLYPSNLESMLQLEAIQRGNRTFINTSEERSNYELVKNYIESGKPLEQIRELDQLREKIKSIVEQHWSVSDLLPDTKKQYLRLLKEDINSLP